ncbi:hypothetical protein ABT369_02375 [Dactylosporangium sp. NPDC000244]
MLAQPRTRQLAETYRRLGFRAVPIRGAAAVLYRPPGARHEPNPPTPPRA